MHEIVGPGLDALQLQLGVEPLDLRVAVMGEVEGAEPVRRQEQDEAGDPGDSVVQAAGAEGGAVHRFVQGREEEDERDAVQDERGEKQERSAAKDHQRARREEQSDMADEMDEAGSVGRLTANGRCSRPCSHICGRPEDRSISQFSRRGGQSSGRRCTISATCCSTGSSIDTRMRWLLRRRAVRRWRAAIEPAGRQGVAPAALQALRQHLLPALEMHEGDRAYRRPA